MKREFKLEPSKPREPGERVVITWKVEIDSDGDLIVSAKNNRGEEKDILYISNISGKLCLCVDAKMEGIQTGRFDMIEID